MKINHISIYFVQDNHLTTTNKQGVYTGKSQG